ncbi:hypothetical protein [Niabella aurantiaca]|uniref:hypothetical protein n=1 Tax=Niabella aurantiaca TaxID=379900 RepID=UPI000381F449|nr:hypothetical protein [Niabella aurantiaca]
MNRLTSKLQFRDFEKGEFTGIAARYLRETMALIHQYPWTDQRLHFVVGHTGPGMVVQDDRGNYLKLALFYNNKYITYYCNSAGQLYQQTLEKPEDVAGALTTFFALSDNPPEGFHLQKNFFRNTKEHFQTRDFRYSVQDLSFWQMISRGSTLFYIFIWIFFIGTIFPDIRNYDSTGTQVFLFVFFFILFSLGGGLNLLLLYRYYRTDKNTVIICSKGLPDFYFGTAEQQTRYKKQDILKIELKGQPNTRSPIRDFAVYKIYMTNGTVLPFTSILIPPDQLREKMHGIPVEAVQRFAWPSSEAI